PWPAECRLFGCQRNLGRVMLNQMVKKLDQMLKKAGNLVRFPVERLAAPRFSSLSGCLDV
ncbi:hypothetical protein, partial [Pseudacidovorax intermedius]|uniref:hypothetical protein n=1 Tax=Pseudacidovorax intermedius TaxID=433924 RepID=UPI0026E9B677